MLPVADGKRGAQGAPGALGSLPAVAEVEPAPWHGGDRAPQHPHPLKHWFPMLWLSPKPSGGILIKFKKANATDAARSRQAGRGAPGRVALALPSHHGRCGHTRVHGHAYTWPHTCSLCPYGGTGSVPGRDSASRSWRGSELFLQRSSFSFRLQAALPSVIKIYQCEPKHLALHLLL